MSVSIQLLFSCDDFRKFIIDNDLNKFTNIYKKLTNEKNSHIILPKDSKEIFKNIKNIFNKLVIKSNNKPIRYHDIYRSLYRYIFSAKTELYKQQDVIFFLQLILVHLRIDIFNFTLIQKKSNNIFNRNINQILILNEFNENKKRIEPSTLQDIINYNTKLTNNRSSINIDDTINKYIIINLNRGGNDYSTLNNNSIFINKEINITDKRYFLIGSIIKIGDQDSGHYIYITFDSNGKIYKVYDDSNISNNTYVYIYKSNKINEGKEIEEKKINEEKEINKKKNDIKMTIESLLSTSSVIFLFKKFDNVKS
jgi:hypothetical protein